ncbi:uncharacterized protein EAF02_011801 [Botrytis sinoallii]|uniref:uncharacterized protein n=1 Tax=Botrytis sinoallii TaxID=1463999 RepID=UPI00190224F4|nr:uncharacterized protein EAF02_011801 [Botrytis sinoallii]KAF7853811.1 hypothetical protein EAF02_011801 [Botrytis sinoallii]
MSRSAMSYQPGNPANKLLRGTDVVIFDQDSMNDQKSMPIPAYLPQKDQSLYPRFHKNAANIANVSNPSVSFPIHSIHLPTI